MNLIFTVKFNKHCLFRINVSLCRLHLIWIRFVGAGNSNPRGQKLFKHVVSGLHRNCEMGKHLANFIKTYFQWFLSIFSLQSVGLCFALWCQDVMYPISNIFNWHRNTHTLKLGLSCLEIRKEFYHVMCVNNNNVFIYPFGLPIYSNTRSQGTGTYPSKHQVKTGYNLDRLAVHNC